MAVREGQSRRRAAPDADPPRTPRRAVSGAAGSGVRPKGGPRADAPLAQAKRPKRWKPNPSAFLLIALALVVALAGVGFASYAAATALGHVARAAARRGAETPSALAATVCADFLHQNYDDLIPRVDPKPAQPAATGGFDASATLARLRTIDQRDGPVSSCTATRLDASQTDPQNGPDGATRLLLVMWRVGDPIASVLITRQDPDTGAWLIERDSSFLLAT